MAKNIENFNLAVVLIVALLIERFPEEKALEVTGLALKLVESDPELKDLNAKAQAHYEIYTVLYNTAYFLLAEGFIRGVRHKDTTVISDCVLTTKGFEACGKKLDALSPKKSLGEFFVELAKEGLKAGSKEGIVAAVRALLS